MLFSYQVCSFYRLLGDAMLRAQLQQSSILRTFQASFLMPWVKGIDLELSTKQSFPVVGSILCDTEYWRKKKDYLSVDKGSCIK